MYKRKTKKSKSKRVKFRKPTEQSLKRLIHIYALKLKDDKYYVGITRNPTSRYMQHKMGRAYGGAAFTSRHEPLRIIETRCLNTNDDKIAEAEEDRLTIQYAVKYGSTNVRGGKYLTSSKQLQKAVDKYKIEMNKEA